jgi:hypothetical protein
VALPFGGISGGAHRAASGWSIPRTLPTRLWGRFLRWRRVAATTIHACSCYSCRRNRQFGRASAFPVCSLVVPRPIGNGSAVHTFPQFGSPRRASARTFAKPTRQRGRFGGNSRSNSLQQGITGSAGDRYLGPHVIRWLGGLFTRLIIVYPLGAPPKEVARFSKELGSHTQSPETSHPRCIIQQAFGETKSSNCAPWRTW